MVAGFLMRSGRRNGRTRAEIEPASRTSAKNSARFAEIAAMLRIEPPIVKMIAIATATMTALIGDWLRSLILASPMGKMRSNASANMTRVTTATKARSTASSAAGTARPMKIFVIGSPERTRP